MSSSSGPLSGVLRSLDDRSKPLLGALFGAVGLAHFYRWTRGEGVGFVTDLRAGAYAAAADPLLSYLAAHPAYPLLALAGVLVLVRALRE